ncbi:MAG: DUF2284 domain-containing protein [Methanospirillum sp.]|nr:DUF2284 domain-containing protein [Methanospirillum sp.]
MPQTKEITTDFEWIRYAALDLGATDAKVIPTAEVVVENRVPLLCRSGCVTYGTRLTCPPRVPTPDEFRRILSEYSYALLVQFTSDARADPDIICSLCRNIFDPEADPEQKQKASEFMDKYTGGNTGRLDIMLELEKKAFNGGCTFALAFVNGSCRLCKTCNLKEGTCLHPTRARIPEHAVGINMVKTAEKAGMPIHFPVTGSPRPMAILLLT